jgi:hypothetical protein
MMAAASTRGTPSMILHMAPIQDRDKWIATLKAIRKLPEKRTKKRGF